MTLSANLILIALTCAVSFYAFSHPDFLERWLLNPYREHRQKRIAPYLTHGFLHADGTHLLFNMITLYFFGRAMEDFFQPHFGGVGYYVFYLGGIIIAILPSALPNRRNPRYSTLGASGAVSAVLFSYILLQPWSMLLIYFIPVPAILYAVGYVAYSIYLDKKGGDNINHSAHLWGAAYGVVFTVLIEPEVLPRFITLLFDF